MKSRVLIAESDRNVADELGQFLSSRGYRVEIANGGLDALEKMRDRMPQFVVMSAELPWGGCDGVLEIMRSGNDVPQVPVVLTETRSEIRDWPQFRGPPVVEHVRKPFAPGDVFDILEGMTRKRSSRSGGRNSVPMLSAMATKGLRDGRLDEESPSQYP